jgi:hypothetical protein
MIINKFLSVRTVWIPFTKGSSDEEVFFKKWIYLKKVIT